MTAKGKITASKVTAGDRIIVVVYDVADPKVHESRTKTGEGVQVARVTSKYFRTSQGPYEAQGKYVIETSAGTFEAGGQQTMWLAPEDNAGIKRAHAEALAEDIHREALAHEARAARLAEEEAADHSAVAELADPMKEAMGSGLGRTLRPILEARVRLARAIPEGRRRHGQTKARRDALRHARKLELAGV